MKVLVAVLLVLSVLGMHTADSNFLDDAFYYTRHYECVDKQCDQSCIEQVTGSTHGFCLKPACSHDGVCTCKCFN